MIYHYSGAYLSAYDVLIRPANGTILWVRPMRSVDLHMGYAFDSGFKLRPVGRQSLEELHLLVACRPQQPWLFRTSSTPAAPRR
ncbi:hypothetical protein ACRAWD_00930 [Caulobacter segnis]